jgi:hypothetical protein
MIQKRRLAAALAAAALTATVATTVVRAHGIDVRSDDGGIDNAKATHDHHAQHGEEEGHLPAGKTDNIELVSKLELRNVEPGKIADVGVHEGYAYLAAWGGETCKYNGVHVVDVRDPSAPEEVAFIVAKEGSAPGEGIQALHIDTPKFDGDILVTNNEVCKAAAGFGGLNIYDVTNPTRPTPLAVGIGDSTANGQGKKTANEIHSVFAWDAGDKAYAVIVDNEEGPDVDIMDITDPKKPVLHHELDLDATFPQIVQDAPENLTEIFHHDVVVKQIDGKYVMLISYWDAGYVAIDVTVPHAPVYMGDTDFALEDPELADVAPEGNAHQAEFAGADDEFVLAADEDFGPYALIAGNTTDSAAINASSGSNTVQLEEGQEISGPSTFVGRACPGDPAVPAGDAATVDIAVVERGLCTFTEKIASVEAAGGWDAVLVFNREGSDGCTDTLGMSVEGGIPAFGVAPRDQGYAIFGVEAQYDETACRAGDGLALAPIAIGASGDSLSFSSTFDGWGYVHLYDNEPGKMTELDTYAIPQAHDPEFATGSGDLSVHEVATSARNPALAYVSYYAAGLRVIEIVDDEIVERGFFIDEGGNNFWGVQIFEVGGVEYVAASDRDHGLYIFTYTP